MGHGVRRPQPRQGLRRPLHGRPAGEGAEGRLLLLPLRLEPPGLRLHAQAGPSAGAGGQPVLRGRRRGRGPGRLGAVHRLPGRSDPRAGLPVPAGPDVVRRRVGPQRGAVAHPRTRRADPLARAGRRLQRAHAQRGRLRHPRAGRPHRTAGRSLGVVPDDQRLVGVPAPRPQPQVARPDHPLLHGDHRRGRQPAARRRSDGGRHHPAAAGRAPGGAGGVDRQALRGGVREAGADCPPGTTTVPAPSPRTAGRSTWSSSTRRAPRSACADWSPRSAGSPSSAPARNSVTGSSADSTRPWASCGSTHAAAADLDPYATVLKVELEGELELYRGSGRF